MESDTNADSGTSADEPKTVSMTQDALDKLISERVNRAVTTAKGKWDKEKAAADKEAAEKADLEKLEGEARAKKEYELAQKKLTEERDAAYKDLRLMKARATLAEKGLNADFASTMVGADDEQTKKNIDALEKMVNDQVQAKAAESLKKGAPPTPNSNEGGNGIKDVIFDAFNLKKE